MEEGCEFSAAAYGQVRGFGRPAARRSLNKSFEEAQTGGFEQRHSCVHFDWNGRSYEREFNAMKLCWPNFGFL